MMFVYFGEFVVKCCLFIFDGMIGVFYGVVDGIVQFVQIFCGYVG